MHPKGVVDLLREVAQVKDVNAEQAKEHERLRPLGRVAPEHAGVFDDERASVGPGGQGLGETLLATKARLVGPPYASAQQQFTSGFS